MNGMVELDSPFGSQIGFTSDKFEGYLWVKDGEVTISSIESLEPGKGNLSQLFARIEAAGFRVAVPNPLPKMEAILRHKGFAPAWEPFFPDEPDERLQVAVWRRPQ